MFLNENYAILEEDEDLDMLDEEYDDFHMEGSILDEDMGILNEAITSSSDVDVNASSEAIKKAKDAINKAISSGKYRAYKSSDSHLVEKAVKSKNMIKTAAIAIAGSIVGGLAGGGVNKAVDKYKINKAFKDKDKNKSKQNNKAFINTSERKLLGVSEGANLIMNEAFEMYMDAMVENVFNEAKTSLVPVGQTKTKKVEKYKDTSKAISAGVGAVAGGAAGTALAKKIISGMKYKVFNLNGLPILTFYTTNKEAEAKGRSVCYALATSVDGTKLMMKKVALKSK